MIIMSSTFAAISAGLITASLVGAFILNVVAADSRARIELKPVCSLDTAERRSTFVIDCAKAANPHSDEEGEDLVKQCQTTAEELFCAKEKHVLVGDFDWRNCSTVKGTGYQEACK